MSWGKNKLKEILGRGEVALGTCISTFSPALEVEEVVEAAKFPPQGHRGYGGLCWSGKWGVDAGPEWVRWSDEETLVLVMIEDDRALKNLDGIMSVDGLDAVQFGPADYSFSIGVPGQTSHPRVMDALKKIIEVAKKHRKAVCMGVGFPWVENARKFIEMGCQLIEFGHDVTILQNIWKRTLAEVRGKG
jgi:2-keto-3-deoxy-L-rhamnonate aldolase RhmA